MVSEAAKGISFQQILSMQNCHIFARIHMALEIDRTCESGHFACKAISKSVGTLEALRSRNVFQYLQRRQAELHDDE